MKSVKSSPPWASLVAFQVGGDRTMPSLREVEEVDPTEVTSVAAAEDQTTSSASAPPSNPADDSTLGNVIK